MPSIDLRRMRDRGIRALLLDLDNTLVPWREYDISPGVIEWLRRAKDLGFKLCIVSNTRTAKRLTRLAGEMDLPYVKKVLKPRRRGFQEAIGILGAKISETAVIGDQIFTDILGGNRLGIHTVLVTPLHTKEFLGTKVSRFVEGLVLGLLERRGLLCTFSTDSGVSGEQSGEISSQM